MPTPRARIPRRNTSPRLQSGAIWPEIRPAHAQSSQGSSSSPLTPLPHQAEQIVPLRPNLVETVLGRVERGVVSPFTASPSQVAHGVRRIGFVGLWGLAWPRMVPTSVGRTLGPPLDHAQGAAPNRSHVCRVGASMGQPRHCGSLRQPGVLACLHSRTSHDKHIMHMLRTLAFVEAFSLLPEYINTRDNHLANDLSRDRLSSFLSKVPHAAPRPPSYPLNWWSYSSTRRWIGSHRAGSICSALLSRWPRPFYPPLLRFSNEEVQFLLRSLPCRRPISGHRVFIVYIRRVLGR